MTLLLYLGSMGLVLTLGPLLPNWSPPAILIFYAFAFMALHDKPTE